MADPATSLDDMYARISAEKLTAICGAAAVGEARRLADGFQERGNLEGAILWRRIMKECERLLKN